MISDQCPREGKVDAGFVIVVCGCVTLVVGWWGFISLGSGLGEKGVVLGFGWWVAWSAGDGEWIDGGWIAGNGLDQWVAGWIEFVRAYLGGGWVGEIGVEG